MTPQQINAVFDALPSHIEAAKKALTDLEPELPALRQLALKAAAAGQEQGIQRLIDGGAAGAIALSNIGAFGKEVGEIMAIF